MEHWLFGLSTSSGRFSTAAQRHGTTARGARGPGTLLGPEGTAAGGPLGQDRLQRLHRRAAAGTARTLRTAQWTRASHRICICQVSKGARWMPWHQEPMKDVGACDKPRGVGNQTSIRGFPNGETRWSVMAHRPCLNT